MCPARAPDSKLNPVVAQPKGFMKFALILGVFGVCSAMGCATQSGDELESVAESESAYSSKPFVRTGVECVSADWLDNTPRNLGWQRDTTVAIEKRFARTRNAANNGWTDPDLSSGFRSGTLKVDTWNTNIAANDGPVRPADSSRTISLGDIASGRPVSVVETPATRTYSSGSVSLRVERAETPGVGRVFGSTFYRDAVSTGTRFTGQTFPQRATLITDGGRSKPMYCRTTGPDAIQAR